MDLTTAIAHVNAAVTDSGWHDLRDPEMVVLKGTWHGLTYDQMAQESEYSTNYLMRDVAPKLWRQLSAAFGRSVGKTNFRAALDAYAESNVLASSSTEIPPSTATASFGDRARQDYATEENAEGSAIELSDIDGEEPNIEGFKEVPAIAHNSRLSAMPAAMYGYTAELAFMKQWLIDAHSENAVPSDKYHHLMGVWGLHGIGKSLLVETAVSQVGKQFDDVVWRSLQHRPSLSELCSSILNYLNCPASEDQSVARLLNLMSQQSLLLVLEGMESILQPGRLAGDYRSTHQEYQNFFRAMASSRSSIIATGTEGPADWIRLGGEHSGRKTHSLYLTGLNESDASVLLQAESLTAPKYWPELTARHQGHPLALKSVARVIREMFNGKVNDFLNRSTGLLADIRRLIEPSFERLSDLELSIVYWLASQEEPLSLAALQETLPIPLDSAELISALDSLKQRSLLTVRMQSDLPVFYLPTLGKTFALHQFMGQMSGRYRQGAVSRQSAGTAAEPNLDRFIRLGTQTSEPVQLGQWLHNNFAADWLPLDYLFSADMRIERLRNAYHLRDEAFVKRFKSISFNGTSKANASEVKTAALIVAIYEENEGDYKICVQAQPTKNSSVLPENLTLKLLDTQKNLLAAVKAEQGDTFIQLPYFLGVKAESFLVELAIDTVRHTETFMV